MTPFVIPFSGTRLDLAKTLDCGQVFRWSLSESGFWEGRDGAARFKIRQVGDRLEGEATGGAEAVHRLLDLEFDETRLMDQVKAECPNLPVAHRRVRLVQMNDAVEVVFSFLCTANNNLHRIVPMVRYLAPLGTVFPTVEEVALLDPVRLRSHGFGYRADWVPRAAQAILAQGGLEWLRSLRLAPYSRAFSAMVALPGFGPKLADCVLLYGLGHTEAFPIDTHVWKALAPTVFPQWEDGGLTLNRYRYMGDWMRERFGADAGRVNQLVFVDRLHTHGSRRLVKGLGEKISPPYGNAGFEAKKLC